MGEQDEDFHWSSKDRGCWRTPAREKGSLAPVDEVRDISALVFAHERREMLDRRRLGRACPAQAYWHLGLFAQSMPTRTTTGAISSYRLDSCRCDPVDHFCLALRQDIRPSRWPVAGR